MNLLHLTLLLFLVFVDCPGNTNNETTPCDDFMDIVPIADLDCGAIEVPENHDDPRSKKIQITYVVLKAKNKDSKRFPMIYFSGGPGGASLSANRIRNWYESPIRVERDIILFDQRGIGHSSALPNMESELFDIMSADADEVTEQDMMNKVISQYRQKCEARNISLQHYNSFQNARDVGMLMKYLGYKKYNLYGVSYGTRLARIVQDEFPELLTSVIHNSPNPLRGDFLIDRLHSYSLALSRIFAYCKNDPDCNKNYPELKESYLQAIASLDKHPITVSMPDGIKFVVNAQDAIYLLRRKLYGNDSRKMIPALIKEYNEQKSDLLRDIISTELLFSDSYNSSMWLSVERYEMFDPKYTPEVIEEVYNTLPLLPEKLGMFSSFYNAGRNWHNARLSNEDKIFKMSSIPTLVTVNHYDPVTPPENGHIFLEHLKNGQLYILDEGGHGGGNAACRSKVMIDFMDDPSGKLDTSCLNIYSE